ncbi:uncharacterized protein [Rutidosis leptorrhynchoides]|uniref:uncharacterized protein n=1 Tax=Rutidosis leptorrhynchoides TaxID=125765 RepID=UPI003A9A506E
MMLGRVRASSLSSLQVLEMERTPSKLLKDDSLSIYEKTLLKLQQGSRRDLSLIPDESVKTDTTISSNESSVVVDAPAYASTDSVSSSGNVQPMIVSKEKRRGNLSVVYMFSKYESSKNGDISSCDDNGIEMEDDCSFANTSPHGFIVDPVSPI